MIERYTHNKITWLDVLNPSNDDVRDIFSECKLPTEFGGDLTSMTPKTETLVVKGSLKITLDFPVVKRLDIKHPHEVKFIVTKNHLITIRFEEMEAIHRFSKEFEVLTLLKAKSKSLTGMSLFCSLLKHMYESQSSKLDYLESKLRAVEDSIFDENDKEMLFELSRISRRLISFRHTIGAHQPALDALNEKATAAFGATYAPTVNEIMMQYTHLVRRSNELDSTLQDLRDTNTALINTKQNEVMKIFTIMAFITFPLTLFTSMFGMNTTTTPLLGHKNDFWIILGIMVVVSVGFFAFFRYKRWI